MKWLIFLFSSIGSYLGWWLGAEMSSDPTWAVLLCCVGTLAGVVVGWWIGWKAQP